MKQLLLVIAGFILFVNAPAQDPHIIDSLRKELYLPMHDTSRVQSLLNGFATQYYMSDPKRAMKYCEQARELSEKINYVDGMASSYGWLAYLHEQQGEINEAIAYNEKSLALFRKTGNRKEESIVLNNLAAIYKDRGNIPEAIRYNNESLKLKEEIGDSVGIATTYNNFGIIYSNQGNIPLSLDYYFKALRIQEKLNDQEGVATAWHNIGLVYKEQGDLGEARNAFDKAFTIRKRDNDKYSIAYSLNAYGGLAEIQDSLDAAINYYNQALSIRREIDDKQGMAHTLKNIGGILDKKQLSGSDTCYRKSLEYFTEMDDKWGMTTVLTKLAGQSFMSGDFAKSQQLATRSLELAKSLGYPSEIRDASYILKQVYTHNRQWMQVSDMSDLYYSMRDSVQNKESRKELYRQQLRYEYEKKETALKADQDKKDLLAAAEVKAQKTQKYLYLGGFAIVIIFTIILSHRFNITRKQKVIIEHTLGKLQSTQQQLIESEKMAAFGTLASRVAHEIQNPLNFINNFSDISKELITEFVQAGNDTEKTTVQKDLMECLDKINSHGKRAGSIVSRLQEHIRAGKAHEFFEDDANSETR